MAVGTTNYPTSLDTVVELIEAANNASTTLDGAIDDSVTTITVASTSGFAASGVIAIDNELISYTAKTATDFTGCTRGFEGTAAASHLTGVDVEQIITARSHNVLASAIIATQTKLGAGTAIALNKLATVTASRALVSDASGYASASSVTAAELGYLSGVTSAIQTQLGNKAATGAIGSSGLTMATARLLGRSTAGSGAVEEITVGSGLSLAGGTLTATGGGGSGTVTSVGLSLPAIFTVSGSPVTTSGTLTGALADQNANVIFAGPSTGAATAPTFRSLVAADIPGVLSVTKLSNLTSNGFVKTGSGDGTLSVDTSTYLTANQTITLSGDVTGSGTTSITATIASAAVTYAKIQNVSATSRILGRKTAGAGSIEELTLTEALDFAGTAAQGDVLYRGASGWALLPAGTNGHYLQTQGAGANPQWAAAAGGSSGLTIGTTAITSGTAGRILYETSGNVVGEIAGSSADANGAVQFAASARTSGVAQYFRINTPADTGLTASTESVGAYFGGNGSGSTVTRTWAAGTVTSQSEYTFVAPTYAGASATATFTRAATVAITGAPVAGANATITNPIALDVTSGQTTATAMRALGVASQSTSVPIFRVDSSGSAGGSYPTFAVMGAGGSRNGGPRIFLGSTVGSGNFDIEVSYNRIEIRESSLGGSSAGLVGTLSKSGWAVNALVLPAQFYVVSGATTRPALRVDSATNSTVALNQFYLNADDTSTVAQHTLFAANSNGTAAAGFGGQLLFQAESTTTENRDAAAINWLWTTATDASRTAAITLSTVSNAGSLAEVWRVAGASAGNQVQQTITGPNGGTNAMGVISENLTLSTGGTTTDTTIDLPANSIILSVTGRITTTITTATDWKLGDPTVADRFSDANATLTSGTTTVGINQWKADRTTAGQGAFQQSTAKVRVTTTGTPGAGVIRITVHYITLTAPTS